jgi:hypothetical protein
MFVTLQASNQENDRDAAAFRSLMRTYTLKLADILSRYGETIPDSARPYYDSLIRCERFRVLAARRRARPTLGLMGCSCLPISVCEEFRRRGGKRFDRRCKIGGIKTTGETDAVAS